MTDRWRPASIIYRVCLALFPRRFRDVYGDEMAETFRARLSKTLRDGPMRALVFCIANYLDALRTAGAEWIAASTPTAPNANGGWTLDLRHAWRSILARPGFSIVVVLTLALAIGANTAMFSVVQAVLLNPPPFRDPDRIIMLGERSASIDTEFVSPITYDDWKMRNEAFEGLAAFRYWETVNLEDAGEPESVNLVTATANFFSVLGVQPLLGQTYRDEQSKAGGSEAVISHELWTRRYHRDPMILGKTIRVRGATTTIVGVLPASSLTLSLGWGDVWTCLYRYNVQEQRATSYRARYLGVVGRLKPGVSLAQARARMGTLQRQLAQESTSVAVGYEVRLTPVMDSLSGRARLSVTVLAGAVGLVLLIACANVANLMLVRSAARRRDTAVRQALGAGSAQLVRLLMSESLLLAATGAGAGVALAQGLLVVLAQLKPDIPRIGDAALTPDALAFTAAITVGAAVLFSLAPLLDLRRADLRDALTAGRRGAGGSPAARRARSILVASQMALACMLLVCGGLLFRSLENLLRVDPGFRAQNAVMFDVSLPSSRYPTERDQGQFFKALEQELAETPGVSATGGLLYFVYRPKLWLTHAWPDGMSPADGEEPVVFFNLVAGDYFQAMGIPLKAGRWPDAREMWDQPRAIVVNEALAAQLFPGGQALGRHLRTDRTGPAREIVGIAGDVRQKRLDEPPKPELYTTFSSMPMPFMTVVVRTQGAPELMLDTIRGVIRRRDPGLAVANLATLASYLEAHTSDRRFALTLLAMFGALAVVLGAIGVYGVMSFSVAQRQREIAIRLALGAAPRGVRSMVVRDALRVVLAGAAAGLAAAALAGRLIGGLLFGVGGIDPLTYAVVPAALAAVAMLASWIPARRAAGVDALGSLRGE
jgi:putative ABC transport system permease protein